MFLFNSSVDNSAARQVIRESMEYRHEHVNEPFEPIVRATYQCVQAPSADFLTLPKCDFTEARRILQESEALAKIDVELGISVIDSIEREPAEFLPFSAKGFRLQRVGLDLIELAQDPNSPTSANPSEMQQVKEPKRNVWGWLDLQKVRFTEKQTPSSFLREYFQWWK